jgi:hypothetical protein
VQGLAAVTSIGGAFAVAAQKPDWFEPVISGAACLIVWKFVQLLSDNRVKSADKSIKRELARAAREGEERTRLVIALRQAVTEKVKRLRRTVTRRSRKPSIVQVRNALTPQPHLNDLLEALAVFLQERLPPDEGQKVNFRIGVYIDQTGELACVHGISLNDPSYNPFSSSRERLEAFRLNNTTNPALVVCCIRDKSTLLVEDCIEAEARGKFSFFKDAQRSYLRSMLAYYLGEVCDEDGRFKAAALAVDTDLAGYFKESDRDSLNFFLREFGIRLKLELLLLALIARRETSNEHPPS